MSSEALPARELMDQVYRHQRHIYDATRKYYLLGRDHLIARLDPPDGGDVLELGCGTGRNLIAAARRYPQARFYGVDISREMLATARGNVTRAGLDSRILLVRDDATRVDPAMFGLQRFDRVFFSYSLSMIPPWRQALAHGASLLAPGGRLSLVDFGQQDGLPLWFRSLLFVWLQRFHVSPPADLADAVRSVAAEVEARSSFVDLYRGYACYAEISLPAEGERHGDGPGQAGSLASGNERGRVRKPALVKLAFAAHRLGYAAGAMIIEPRGSHLFGLKSRKGGERTLFRLADCLPCRLRPHATWGRIAMTPSVRARTSGEARQVATAS